MDFGQSYQFMLIWMDCGAARIDLRTRRPFPALTTPVPDGMFRPLAAGGSASSAA